MTPDGYRLLTEVFLAVCDLPADRRAGALDHLCGKDGVLRAEVESLLQFYFPAEAPAPPGEDRACSGQVRPKSQPS